MGVAGEASSAGRSGEKIFRPLVSFTTLEIMIDGHVTRRRLLISPSKVTAFMILRGY